MRASNRSSRTGPGRSRRMLGWASPAASIPARQARPGLPRTLRVGAPSVFVTGTAWLFILLSGLICGAALVFGLRSASLGWLAGGLVLSVTTLACALGLLLRHDWGRRSLIGLLGLALVANLGAAWLEHGMRLGEAIARAVLPLPLVALLGGPEGAARGVALGLAVLAGGLLVWVMRRLMAPAVRQEFA